MTDLLKIIFPWYFIIIAVVGTFLILGWVTLPIIEKKERKHPLLTFITIVLFLLGIYNICAGIYLLMTMDFSSSPMDVTGRNIIKRIIATIIFYAWPFIVAGLGIFNVMVGRLLIIFKKTGKIASWF